MAQPVLSVRMDEQTKGDIAAFCEEVRAMTGKTVDVLSKRSIDNPELAKAVAREGVIVYEREEQ